MAATQVKVKQEKLESEDAEEQAKQLAAAQTAAALAGVMPVGLNAQQMQQVLASSAALGNLGQLGNLQYISGVLAANPAAAAVTQSSGVTGPCTTASVTSPLLVVPQFPAQYMTYLPQLAAAQTSLSSSSSHPQATAAVTPSATTYDAGVLDLSKGPSSKTPSPNTPDSGTNGLANIPYDARERTKTEKTSDVDELKEELESSGKKGTSIG